MATFDSVRKKVQQLPKTIQQFAPQIVAETATEYFKNSFREKGLDGQAWDAVKNEPGKGSLMVRSGQLQASIRPSVVSAHRVVISAGSPSVPYAKIHNEGGTIRQIPTEKQRKFLWAMEKKSAGGALNKEDATDATLGKWGAMAMAKELVIKIPQRKFMAQSPILNKEILKRLELLIKN